MQKLIFTCPSALLAMNFFIAPNTVKNSTVRGCSYRISKQRDECTAPLVDFIRDAKSCKVYFNLEHRHVVYIKLALVTLK